MIAQLALDLLDDLNAVLSSAPFRPVCKKTLRWGPDYPPQDLCGCKCENGGNGEAWVQVLPSTEIPGLAPRPACPPGLWNIQLRLGIYRCVTVFEKLPNPVKLTEESLLLLEDAAALRQVLMQTTALHGPEGQDFKSRSWSVVDWTPIARTGGCAGSAITILVEGESQPWLPSSS